MGYEAEGFCLGMQVGNPSPEQFVVGLTPNAPPRCLCWLKPSWPSCTAAGSLCERNKKKRPKSLSAKELSPEDPVGAGLGQPFQPE